MSNVFTPVLVGKEGGDIFTALPGHHNVSGFLSDYLIGNAQVAVVMHTLSHTPMRVAWVGEDAYEDMKKLFLNNPFVFPLGGGFIKTAQDFLKYYSALWEEGSPIRRNFIKIKGDVYSLRSDGDIYLHRKDTLAYTYPHGKDFYIVNITKKCYLDMAEYYAQGKAANDLTLREPLPMLTALWNNPKLRSNYKGNKCREDVGSWAFDEIFVSDENPTSVGILCRGYKKVSFCFCNN